jgi:hypothetical protein
VTNDIGAILINIEEKRLNLKFYAKLQYNYKWMVVENGKIILSRTWKF